MGPSKQAHLPPDQLPVLLDIYKRTLPAYPIALSTEVAPGNNVSFLVPVVFYHDYMVLQGRRITPSAFNGHSPNSIVQCLFEGKRYAGEVAAIVSHVQTVRNQKDVVLRQHLLAVRWFRRLQDFDASIWGP